MKTNIAVAVWWFVAFALSWAVTYILPGTNDTNAWIDAMSVMISLACFFAGCVYVVFAMQVAWLGTVHPHTSDGKRQQRIR